MDDMHDDRALAVCAAAVRVLLHRLAMTAVKQQRHRRDARSLALPVLRNARQHLNAQLRVSTRQRSNICC